MASKKWSRPTVENCESKNHLMLKLNANMSKLSFQFCRAENRLRSLPLAAGARTCSTSTDISVQMGMISRITRQVSIGTSRVRPRGSGSLTTCFHAQVIFLFIQIGNIFHSTSKSFSSAMRFRSARVWSRYFHGLGQGQSEYGHDHILRVSIRQGDPRSSEK